jgi:hypothetical protein
VNSNSTTASAVVRRYISAIDDLMVAARTGANLGARLSRLEEEVTAQDFRRILGSGRQLNWARYVEMLLRSADRVADQGEIVTLDEKDGTVFAEVIQENVTVGDANGQRILAVFRLDGEKIASLATYHQIEE